METKGGVTQTGTLLNQSGGNHVTGPETGNVREGVVIDHLATETELLADHLLTGTGAGLLHLETDLLPGWEVIEKCPDLTDLGLGHGPGPQKDLTDHETNVTPPRCKTRLCLLK